jgi:hypothetical protein
MIVPAVKAPMHFVVMIENFTQFCPPMHRLVTAIGDHHQLYFGIGFLNPTTDV